MTGKEAYCKPKTSHKTQAENLATHKTFDLSLGVWDSKKKRWVVKE